MTACCLLQDKPKINTTVLNECRIFFGAKMTVDECFEVVISVYENDDKFKGTTIFSNHTLRIIHSHILGNFLVNHFALNESLDDAKRALSRMSLILDWEGAPHESLQLLNCVLGWSARLVHANDNGHTTADSISAATLDKISIHRRLDLELYKYGLDLIMENYLKNFKSEKH